jgi:hypothetical protein
MNSPVSALAVFDDGGGPALYAGGAFTSAGGATRNRIAKWNGSSWSALGSGMGPAAPLIYVRDLAVYDDGSGPALHAGGSFTSAGGVAANHMAKWDGTTWSALGSGMDGTVTSLTVFDDGGGEALYAGGFFTSAFDSGDSYLAKWGCDGSPILSCPSSVLVLDRLGSPPGEIVTFTVTAEDNDDPSPTIECIPPSCSFFPRGTTIVNCTAIDDSGHQSTCEFPVTVQAKYRRF